MLRPRSTIPVTSTPVATSPERNTTSQVFRPLGMRASMCCATIFSAAHISSPVMGGAKPAVSQKRLVVSILFCPSISEFQTTQSKKKTSIVSQRKTFFFFKFRAHPDKVPGTPFIYVSLHLFTLVHWV